MLLIMAYLHASVVHPKGKVPVADLQWRRVIVDQACSDDIVLGNNLLPGALCYYLNL